MWWVGPGKARTGERCKKYKKIINHVFCENWKKFVGHLSHYDESTLTILANIPHLEGYGEVIGPSISWYSELMGVYQALDAIKEYRNRRVHLFLDNLGVVKQYSKQMSYTHKQINKVIRSNGSTLWDAIRKIVKNRIGETTISWIKGHANNPGNEYVDKLSNKYGNQADPHTQTYKEKYQKEDMDKIKAIPKVISEPIYQDYRRFIRTENETINAMNLINNPYQTDINQLNHMVNKINNDWSYTLQTMNHGVNPNSHYTRYKVSAIRTFSIKAFTGKLPTMDHLSERRPDLYKNNTCKVCNQAKETNEHVWECPQNIEINNWKKEFLTEIVNNIQICMSENDPRMNTNEIEAALALIRPLNTDHIDLCNIRTIVQEILNFNKVQDQINFIINLQNITIQQLMKAFCPTIVMDWIKYITNWRYLHRIPNYTMDHECMKQMREVRKLVESLYKESLWKFFYQGRQKIWKYRNTKTIDWEKAHHITQHKKTTKPIPIIQAHPLQTGDNETDSDADSDLDLNVNPARNSQIRSRPPNVTKNKNPTNLNMTKNIQKEIITEAIILHYNMRINKTENNIFYNTITKFKFRRKNTTQIDNLIDEHDLGS